MVAGELDSVLAIALFQMHARAQTELRAQRWVHTRASKLSSGSALDF